MTQFEQLDLLLNEYGGIIQTFQVIDNGISKPVFYSYVKERGLEQAAHGVYVSPDTWTDAMYILHLRCSQAVFSHETALQFICVCIENCDSMHQWRNVTCSNHGSINIAYNLVYSYL